jgi:hypothetical protein
MFCCDDKRKKQQECCCKGLVIGGILAVASIVVVKICKKIKKPSILLKVFLSIINYLLLFLKKVGISISSSQSLFLTGSGLFSIFGSITGSGS